jgi:pimeloyl-ACP methyl ester carboxylesterase
MSVEAPESAGDPTLENAKTGSRRRVEFFGRTPDRMFGCTYLPAGGIRGGVVICPPVGAEFEKNYPRETLLAEALAQRGLSVQRFHYRGVGQSDGDTPGITFESLRDDAVDAAAFLAERTGVSRVAFVGTRLGALIAAAAAPDHAPIVWWEPILEGDRYFRQVFRLVLMRSLKKGEGAPASAERVLADLRKDGWIDVLGHTIGLPLYETTAERSLVDELGTAPREVLLVQLTRDAGLRNDYREVVARLTAIGCTAQVREIEETEAWWFGEHRRGRRLLTAVTADWLLERFPGDSSRP